ncbi:MAG: CocE/NonD family hydrolase [Solirubrobacteraceae bacterium]
MRRGLRLAAASAVVCGAVALPSVATADVTSVLGGHTVSGSAIACTTQPDGTRLCAGDYSSSGGADTRLKTFDQSTPLALDVILPPVPASGVDGSYPFVVQSHGYGQQAGGLTSTQYLGPTADQWAKSGYAVLQLTARGFGDSCGTAASRLADPVACQAGYIRLDDNRYEVRDIQYATGLLVDAGLVDPSRIGLTGESYGGGVSLQLATLNDRIMNADGSLQPWRSPAGTPLHIAAAAPVIPWSDLVYSLLPNGRTLDSQVSSATADLTPFGIEKQSFVTGLYALGNQTGYYAPPMTDSQADLTTWYGAINAGEPYDGNTQDQAIVDQIARYHSAYYLLNGAYGAAGVPPPPLLISNGFTDDLFPVDEAVRYYNLEHSLYPNDPIGLFDLDGGHARGQNKAADLALLANHIQSLFDHYVKGTAAPAQLGATALTQTCPSSAPSGGPYSAPTWLALHPGEVRFSSAPAQTITSGAGNPSISAAIDPIGGQGACATVSAADQGSGVASYRLAASSGGGYTLLGAPTVTADLTPAGTYPMIAARLWDVDPSTNTETLVARGLYRVTSGGAQTFQLHPGAWHFAAGHVPKLELLSQDSPYARTSNGQFSIAVSHLTMRLPVHEVPGAPGTPPIVGSPGSGGRGPGSACLAQPRSQIDRRHVRVRARRLFVSGRANETPCAHASAVARRKQHVRTVFVSVFRGVGHGRCRYVLSNGHLSRSRSCRRPIGLKARGTAHWHLSLRLRLPRGRYLVRINAVDGFRHQQPLRSRPTARIRVR